MPTLVVNDDSFGQGLGHLMGGLTAGNDPEKRAQAMALQATIDARNLAARQTQIENETLLAKRKAQDEAIRTGATQFGLDRIGHIPQTINTPQETLRAPLGTDFQGPLPASPMANPVRRFAEEDLRTGEAIFNNAIRQGATPQQAYQAIELARINAGGVPTNSPQAAKSQALLLGHIGDARVPLTEEQRRVMETEERSKAAALEAQRQGGAMERERLQQETNLIREREQEAGRNSRWESRDVDTAPGHITTPGPRSFETGVPPGQSRYGTLSVPKGNVVIDPNTGKRLGQGYEVPDPNAPPPTPDPYAPMTGSNAENAVNRRAALMYEDKYRAGTLTPEELRAWSVVDSALYAPKREERKTDTGTQIVVTQLPRPPGVIDPRTLVTPPTNPVPGTGQTSVNPPPQPGQTGTVAQTTAAQAEAAGVPTATSGETKTRTVTGPDGSQTTITDVESGDTKLAGAENRRAGTLTITADHHLTELKKLWYGEDEFRPNITSTWTSQRSPLRTPWTEDAVDWAQKKFAPPKAQKWDLGSRQFLLAVLTDRSGATITEPELPRYERLIPTRNDDPETVDAKFKAMDVIVEANRSGANIEVLKRLASLPPEQVLKSQAPGLPGPGTAGASGTAGTPSGPQPDFVYDPITRTMRRPAKKGVQ